MLTGTCRARAGLSLQRKNKEAAVVEILLKGKKVHRGMMMKMPAVGSHRQGTKNLCCCLGGGQENEYRVEAVLGVASRWKTRSMMASQ